MTYQQGRASFTPFSHSPVRIEPIPNILLSVIVPVKDEEDAIGAFVNRVSAVLDGIAKTEGWEILFVDDGSSDTTLAQILAARSSDPRVRAISLSRNFGKEAALSAGIDHALGQAAIPLDVDMQDPPEVLAAMVAKWREGYDVVYGVRHDRSSDHPIKRTTATLFYRVHNWLSPDKIPEHAGDFRLLDRKVIEVLRQLPERNRFMKGLFSWGGFRQIGIPYERAERTSGKTKFGYWKLWTLALDGITSSSTLPIRIWSYIGGVIALLSLTYAAFIVATTLLYGVSVRGYSSLLVAILFLGGVQLLSLGLLGEYVGRVLIEAKGRPVYVVRDSFGVGE
jgi:glycosyltransferase involved in cell wall biosynthesis